MDTLPAKPVSTAVHRILPANAKQAAIVVAGFTALLYLIELIDVVLPADLDQFGIVPRSLSGLDGIAWAPLLHSGFGHLLANTLPVLIFGFLAMAGGLGRWIAVTLTIWLVSGVGVWLTGGDGVTVGASGLAFGWLAFLLVRGIFTRSVLQIGVAAVLLLYWGGMLFGVLPGDPGVSWQGHLFGAGAGVLAAWLVAMAGRRAASRTAAAPDPVVPGGIAE
ncbi:MAG TPA: rhomboid family intramembrane serine protease [Actinophytocola sp.]|uniref:rhomboid family intramembrane serine protease n=1 Tax=Actinophytocola sp. TaxID=1872138 RepID=UPI002DDD1CE1|nr:rhomboid family intramembrane serine protease [Actinophytocola sp.]HEV2780288.1 rhomboid family intramembrane serine protease [Actinophytocola sp.]